MKTIEFAKTGDLEKSAKAYLSIKDFSRKGILKAFVTNEIPALNVMELCAIYDDIHVGRRDFIPEFFPKYSGRITLEDSKEHWGEYWNTIFGENGEHWGKDLHDAKEIGFWKLRNRIEELQNLNQKENKND